MTRGCEWRHAPEAWADIWEKAVSWVPASERESRDSELGETRQICALRVPRVGWVESWQCKSSQHRNIVSLSPHVEKPLTQKGNIKFHTWTNFVFRVFWFPVSISHIRIMGMLQSEPWLLCYYRISSWQQQFLWGNHYEEVIAQPFPSLWNQMRSRNLPTSVASIFLARTPILMDFKNLLCRSISPKTNFS